MSSPPGTPWDDPSRFVESGGGSDAESDEPIGTALAVVGALAVLAALAILFVPGLSEQLSTSYLPVIVIGAVALFRAVQLGWRRGTESIRQATPSAVEARTTVSIPGTRFDRLLETTVSSTSQRIRQQTVLTERLRELTEEILTTHTRRDDPTVPTDVALESGTWTDDPMASSLFAEDETNTSLLDRVAALGGQSSPAKKQAVAVIAELADRLDIEDADRSERSSGRIASSDSSPNPSPTGERYTRRWHGLSALALGALGVGTLTSQPPLVVVAAILLGIAASVVVWDSPTAELAITRTIETPDPQPGAAVRVRVDVENVGSTWAPDVRLVDGVPEGLIVESGSPRHGTSLRPGASSGYAYTVSAPRGRHTFDPAYVLTRTPSGTIERAETITPAGDAEITYDITAASTLSMPLQERASKHVGRVLTDIGGAGLEFHSTREYRPGDPLSRIDWNRAAKGGDLSTLQFREERSATVMFLLDARQDAYVSPTPGAPSAVDRSVLAASELVSALIAADDRVGITALSPRRCWLEPGAGSRHLTRARELLAAADAFGPIPPERPFVRRVLVPTIHKRLPSNAQLVVFSPLSDSQSVTIVRQLRAYGYPVTVISPDATNTGTPGRTLARIERTIRLSHLRRTDTRVVDWQRDESLPAAVERAKRGWS
ncbi:DUF58 domain-containing protein [Halorhabdus sp. CUG00001]|uniref:DUF58 domain-containing protein n=1 Tax=Halorhabdus sp. CUG00001 TaxID=2600297 RepID=UPI00131E24A2|nr:DUF58 domain-containing protein [Halorhabdus sp. CUG00001]